MQFVRKLGHISLKVHFTVSRVVTCDCRNASKRIFLPLTAAGLLRMSSEILQCLEASLNADPNIRISAELRISELFASPGMSAAQSIGAQLK